MHIPEDVEYGAQDPDLAVYAKTEAVTNATAVTAKIAITIAFRVLIKFTSANK